MGWRGAPVRGGGTAAPAAGPSLRPQGSLSRSLRDGRWPTLDPGASTVPDPAAAPGSRTPLPAQRAAQTTATRSKSLQPSLDGFRGLPYRSSAVSIMARSPSLRWASVRVCADGAAVFQSWYVRGRPAWVVTRRNYPMSESEASAQITGISGGFIGTLRLSERTGKNRMVCTITMAGVEELESRELL